MMSVPLQQMARVGYYHEGDLEESLKDNLYYYIPSNVINNYAPNISDGVKNYVDENKIKASLFHSYYRYYNDGDLPGWARTRWDITKYTFDYGYRQRVLTAAGEEEFERRVTERIQIEYRRFQRTHKPA